MQLRRERVSEIDGIERRDALLVRGCGAADDARAEVDEVRATVDDNRGRAVLRDATPDVALPVPSSTICVVNARTVMAASTAVESIEEGSGEILYIDTLVISTGEGSG